MSQLKWTRPELGPPITDLKLASKTRKFKIRTFNLLPDLEKANIAKRQKAKALFKPSRKPRCSFLLRVTSPHTFRLDDPATFPFRLSIVPLLELNDTTPYDATFPKVFLRRLKLRIESREYLSCTVWDRPSDGLDIGSSFCKGKAVLHDLRGTSLEIPVDNIATNMLTADNSLDLGKIHGLRVDAATLNLTPDFKTYKVAQVHSLTWTIELKCAGIGGRRLRYTDRHELKLLGPSNMLIAQAQHGAAMKRENSTLHPPEQAKKVPQRQRTGSASENLDGAADDSDAEQSVSEEDLRQLENIWYRLNGVSTRVMLDSTESSRSATFPELEAADANNEKACIKTNGSGKSSLFLKCRKSSCVRCYGRFAKRKAEESPDSKFIGMKMEQRSWVCRKRNNLNAFCRHSGCETWVFGDGEEPSLDCEGPGTDGKDEGPLMRSSSEGLNDNRSNEANTDTEPLLAKYHARERRVLDSEDGIPGWFSAWSITGKGCLKFSG